MNAAAKTLLKSVAAFKLRVPAVVEQVERLVLRAAEDMAAGMNAASSPQ